MHTPKDILLMSGKRKCGKDYFAEILLKRLNNAAIIRISEPLKGQYAKEHNLDHQELMSDGPYKELHRKAMIEWSDKMRAKEPGYFCNIACNNAPNADVWIVSDIRRKTDINWFYSQFCHKSVSIRSVRITADNAVRHSRGWKFTEGVDDVTSECDLDDYTSWDLIVTNNNPSEQACNENVCKILQLLA